MGIDMTDIRFFAQTQDREAYRRTLKTQPCPFCKVIGWLICHGYLYEYNDTGQEDIRGYRFLCNNRGARGGCGRTRSILLADRIRHSPLRLGRFWDLLRQRLAGKNPAQAARQIDPPLKPTTAYRCIKRLTRTQDHLRVLLMRLCSVPTGEGLADSLQHLIEHLRQAFPNHPCPPAAFQLHFQQSFLV
jgi:hypothetical protein